MPWRRAWQPSPVFLPGESVAWWATVHGVAKRVGHNWTTKQQQQQQRYFLKRQRWGNRQNLSTLKFNCGNQSDPDPEMHLTDKFMYSFLPSSFRGFPGGTSGKQPACQRRRHKRPGFNPESGDPLEEAMAAHSSILPGESYGQRSLAGYSP